MRSIIRDMLLVLAPFAKAETISAQWQVYTPPDMAHSLEFSPDGARLFLGTQQTASVIETSSGKLLHRLAPSEDERWFERVTFTENSDFFDIFHSGFQPPSFARRSLLNGDESHLISLEGGAMSHYAGNPKADTHVTARYNSDLHRIDVQTGKILPFKTDAVSPTAAVAADGSESVVRFSATGDVLRSWPVGDTWRARLAHLSKTEDRLAIGPVQMDQTEGIRVLSLADGQLQDLPFPQATKRYLSSIAFVGDGVLAALVDYSEDTAKKLILFHLSSDEAEEI